MARIARFVVPGLAHHITRRERVFFADDDSAMKRYQIVNMFREMAPRLRNENSEKWKELETARKRFVKDYPIEDIPSLSLNRYVIGKGSTTSFCYRIERELDQLGRITGAPDIKFGVYFSAKDDKYQHSAYLGGSVGEAFSAMKNASIDLLLAAGKYDLRAIHNSNISPLFRWKLLFVYFHKVFFPIYSAEHLYHFAAELNLKGAFSGPNDGQGADLLETRGWDDLASGVVEASYS